MKRRYTSGFRAGLSLVALCLAAPAVWAQETPGQASVETDDGELIIVTGFRASLEKALDIKRESVTAVDAIVAEDIAKFPDQNLAESLQRIPGISIERDGGEGRAITVRGLGAQFTRVRVNGMETVATSTDGAAANRDRAFDFNVFASELFNSIVVHKTARASLDEGSLGAVVDLNTGNPLGGKEGLTIVGNVQGSYNDLSETWGPRVAGLVSWKSEDGVVGASISAAFSSADTLELGNNTVRWAQARFDSVDGTRCFTTANSGGTYVPSAACDRAALAFHPRIPRYGEISHDRERLGVTGSFQLEPSEFTKISVDALYSRFSETRDEYYAEVLFRSNERSIDVVNPVYDGNNNLIAGTFNDAWVRNEAYTRESETEFKQLSIKLDQDITDTLKMSVLAGASSSEAGIGKETTIIMDDRDAQGYRYDYRDMTAPLLTFGTSVLDPANFQLAEIRDRPSSVTNEFATAKADFEWEATSFLNVQGGAVYRKFEFDTVAFTRDTAVCPRAGADIVLGTITCTGTSLPTTAVPNPVYGFAVTPALTQVFQLGDAGQPSGTTSTWLIPNIGAATAFTRLYDRTAAVDSGNTRSVTEEVSGAYVEGTLKGDIGPVGYSLNLGVRYALTQQSSTGLNNGVNVTIDREYDDFLPSLNFNLFPTDNIIVRAAVADVMTRPTLGNLTPGGSVDGFNYRISFGNPQLEPFRARAYDLAVEYYFTDESILSVALFSKDVESFPVSVSATGTYASTGLPLSLIAPSSPAFANPEGQLWTINSITNGQGATLEGVEFSLQTPFTFLPGFLSNFGGIVNATFVDSEATYTVAGPSVAPGGANVNATRTGTLFGLSKEAYNGTLYYEDGPFSARFSVSYRGPYVSANSGTGNVFEGYNATTNFDASARYALNDNFEISLEGINLSDEYRDRYTDLDANRNYEYNHFGRTILFGVRYKN